MSIQRMGTTARWSDAVIFNQTVYTVEVANSADADLRTQAEEVLNNLANTLAQNQSDKSRLLMCTVYLDDIRQIDIFNEIWERWLPSGCAPVRACVQARLAKPYYLVEVQAIAAINV